MANNAIGSHKPQAVTPTGATPAKTAPAQPVTTATPAKPDGDKVAVGAQGSGGAVPAVNLTDDSNAGFQTQADMNAEAGDDAAKADKALNDAYKALTATLAPNDKAKMVAAQKAWIGFREKEATFAANEFKGGSMAPMIYASTVTGLTVDRTGDLTGWKAMRSVAGANGPSAAQDGAAVRAKVADKALNAAYKKLLATQDPDGKSLLQASQRAWIAFRDAELTFAGPAMHDPTLAEMTERRTKQLQDAIQTY